MRILLLLRGAPGCGKTTWIEQNGLKQYALSADDIRLLCRAPELQVDGVEAISQNNEKVVWNMLFNLLETRMKRGDFTVIDATNSKSIEMNRYKKLCDDYRYRIFCVDFTDIPPEVAKAQNASRPYYKQVPEEAIDKMYSRFATQKIPSGITVIKPHELDKIWFKMFDMSDYKKIHVFGDIHGCNTVLQEYFKAEGEIKDDEFYLFTGDYIDRGLENVDVIKFLLSIKDKKNVFLLEGSHERWLWCYGNDQRSRSKEFELITKPELLAAGIDKKDMRQLYRKLGQCAYFKYGDKIFLVTHGGLSNLPGNLSLIATEQMIKGVGSYNDFEKIAETFLWATEDNVYQIHGHRNTKRVPVQVNDKVFNLEGRVEFGGELRCVQIDSSGIHPVEIKNTVYRTAEIQADHSVAYSEVADVIMDLRESKYITEKQFGNISSFNFTPKAFQKGVWDDQTITARGLYIDTYKGKVVARSYNKFFNVNERPETKLDTLQDKLQFPVTAYVKENGFLGIVSWNEYANDLLITSKSSIEGPYAGYLKDMFYKTISPDKIEELKDFIINHNVSLIFECVDMENDPHVIDYPESKLILLDIVQNKIEYRKYPYEQVWDVAVNFGFTCKEKAYEIATWQEFYDWYHEVLEEDYEYKDRGAIEGFVIEDAVGYMVKMKLSYYCFWKYMRSIAAEAIRKGYIDRTGSLTNELSNQFYGWAKELYGLPIEEKEKLPKDICTLRKRFYEQKV